MDTPMDDLTPNLPDPPGTDREIKVAVQELLKYGVLEAEAKPNLFRTLLGAGDRVAAILEPLDLAMRIDDVRGLAFLVVAAGYADSDPDEWSHPLVRRQRLNLEQSLLVALLRRTHVAHELEAGVGSGAAAVHLEELLPEVNHFLGASGSDRQDDKRLRQLLEQLRGHGLVSEINQEGQFTIRPLIVHLANPENLQALLAVFTERAAAVQDAAAPGGAP
jgi:hypothetical protein